MQSYVELWKQTWGNTFWDNCPENSPVWPKETNAEYLWNLVEKSEIRIDARLAREVEFALPVELTQEQSILLAREFIKDQFASRGMLADWSVHWDNPANPHVHVMLTTRGLTHLVLGRKFVSGTIYPCFWLGEKSGGVRQLSFKASSA